MRRDVLVFALAFAFTCYGCGKLNAGTRVTTITSVPAAEKPAPESTAKVDFSTQVKPILEAKCQPCHFSGGKVYSKLPFDRPETIKTLGTKLFTRIKDENERRLISSFLAQE